MISEQLRHRSAIPFSLVLTAKVSRTLVNSLGNYCISASHCVRGPGDCTQPDRLFFSTTTIYSKANTQSNLFPAQQFQMVLNVMCLLKRNRCNDRHKYVIHVLTSQSPVRTNHTKVWMISLTGQSICTSLIKCSEVKSKLCLVEVSTLVLP